MPPILQRRPPTPATAQPLSFPAPTGGLNTVSPATAMPPGDCAAVCNLIPAENGLRSRLGYREWCINLEGSANHKVRALLSFAGSEPSQNRLFATTDSTIYSVSASVDTPAAAFSFAAATGDSGYGVGRVVVTPAGHFYLYCDEVNGLHVYAESGGTWAAVTMGAGASQINGVAPSSLVHLTVFKRRVWFVERDTASAWYLDPNAIYGTAVEFPMGTQFPNGGHLVGLYNWTYDGGAGVDDALVAISSTGDVVIFQGVDPTNAADFNCRGTWNMGPPPAGRDIAREVGGDLYLLSSLGVLPISRLVVGAENRTYETAKIGNLFNQLMLTRRSSRGWSMHLHPEDNALMVLYPDYSTETSRQLAQSHSTKGWFPYRDIPMHCAAVWEGRLHFGTQDGRVCVSRDYVDDVAIDDASSYAEVDWSLAPAFQLAGGNSILVNQIRASFIGDGGAPDVEMAARYDGDLTELSSPTQSAAASGTWDNATWDTDVWGGTATSFTILRGATGEGHSATAAIRGLSNARTTLTRLDAMYEVGGWL
jgi:hypothetical protein